MEDIVFHVAYSFLLAALLVGAMTCLAPLVSTVMTGYFFEGPGKQRLSVKEHPWRFAKIFILELTIGSSLALGFVLFIIRGM